MWGSPGTILAGRELGLDVTASIEWLNARRDADGVWTQQLYGHTTRYLGPAHGFAGCVLALGNVAGVSETLQRLAVEEDGLVNWPSRTGDERWLTRARSFAMHAADQVEQSRADNGRGRHTLWTGDLGTALYLADCIDGEGELPLP
jgi:hypothetical protein